MVTTLRLNNIYDIKALLDWIRRGGSQSKRSKETRSKGERLR